MSSKHPKINFSIEKEKDGCLPFLDVGVYMNFESFIAETYKIGLIKSLLFQRFSLSSDFIKLHHEIDKLKSILYKNSYPRDLIDKCIQEFLDKILTTKPIVSTVPK